MYIKNIIMYFIKRIIKNIIMKSTKISFSRCRKQNGERVEGVCPPLCLREWESQLALHLVCEKVEVSLPSTPF